MAHGTITRTDLISALIKETGLSRNNSAHILEDVLGEIAGCLVKDDPVRIYGFASFSVRHTKKRIGRIPKTGEEIPILPRKVVKFRPSKKLNLRLNQPEN